MQAVTVPMKPAGDPSADELIRIRKVSFFAEPCVISGRGGFDRIRYFFRFKLPPPGIWRTESFGQSCKEPAAELLLQKFLQGISPN